MEHQTYFHSVTLNKDLCRGCINCVKRCPTEAIRVRDGKARILGERCIDCGECIRVCPHHAKRALSDGMEALDGFKYKIALPAPVLFAQVKHLDHTGRIILALKRIGFDDVYEVGAAAELISQSTMEYMATYQGPIPLISSACPAVLRLIRVRFPNLLDHLLPLQPPVELAAVMARRAAVEKTGLKPEEIGIAFITPCPAKVTAVKVPLGNQSRNIDAAIAISRIYPQLIQEIKKMQPEEFVHLSHMGRIGLSWAANSGESTGSGQRRYIAADGIENVIKLLEAVEDEQFTRLDFMELSACPGGCVGGGGQPIPFEQNELADARGNMLYSLDRLSPLRYPHENKEINVLYDTYLGEPMSELAEELLHTDHNSWNMPLSMRLQQTDDEDTTIHFGVNK